MAKGFARLVGRVAGGIGMLSVLVSAGALGPRLVATSGVVAPLDVPVLSARRAPNVIADAVVRRQVGERAALTLRNGATVAARTSCLLAREDGVTVAEHRVDDGVIPASTMKLVTARAALSSLADDFRFTTEVRGDRPPAAGVVQGDIWLVGGGDPLLSTEEYLARQQRPTQVPTSLEDLADAVARSGARTVTGDLVVDERHFDTQRIVAGWKASYVADGQVARLSALTVDDNQMPEPGVFQPAEDPALAAGRRFRVLLRDRGIRVSGDVVDARTKGGAPPSPLLGRVRSAGIEAIVGDLLRSSDNTTAELLVKEMGREAAGTGSTAGGLDVVRAALAPVGPSAVNDQLRFVDGSGLARDNRVTCRLLVEVLESSPADGPLIGGLAVSGRTGTLDNRLRSDALAGKVKGKTGTLDGVSALAGVAERADGTVVTFAVVVNGPVGDPGAEALVDRIVQSLVAANEPVDLAVLAP